MSGATGSTALRRRVLAVLPTWLAERVPRDHRESDAAFRRRRRVTLGVSVVGAGLLGLSLTRRPGSPEFYAATFAVAGVWAAGGVASGPLHLGFTQAGGTPPRRPVLTPVLTGVAAFGAFYGAALVARRVPVLGPAVAHVLRFADQGYGPMVYATTLANGVAEEVFFRGAVYAAIGERHPVPASTAVYALATTATGNPALVLASIVMGGLFGLERRATGGVQAPLLTHLTWSALMLRFLPPLFEGIRPARIG